MGVPEGTIQRLDGAVDVLPVAPFGARHHGPSS
jgi:hypothetical protein